MKILIIAPHPDDEVLGCGGIISKYSKRGDEVFLCIATEGYIPDWTEEFIKSRPAEIEKAGKILGIKETYFLKFPTAKLDTISKKEINDSIFKIINNLKPEVIYRPHPDDLSSDHRLIAESVFITSRPAVASFVKVVYEYETPSTQCFNPDVYENIEENIDIKIEAMKAYQSELKEFPHARSAESLKILAQKRGIESGLKFAEAFKVFREIRY
jgi:N-acetylglucosamine malate deacetylase 1